MFGSSNKNKDAGASSSSNSSSKSSLPASTPHALNSLVQGTILEGKVKATTDIRVDGTIKGDLVCDSKVIIGPTGVVEGTVRCQNAVIEGRFEGNLSVSELLNIRETAKVLGEVSYGKLVVQSGAVISGSYKVAGETSNGAAKSESGKVVSTKSSDAQNIAGKEFAKEKAN
ncbi:MAG: polymer-forming cytoskeletal protein [Bacteroidota bacterium]